MRAPLVSVLLLSYNQAEFLGESLNSALAQTWQPLEVVVVDNGSTDGSRSILERYAGDPRVTVRLHDENGPITASMNEAVQAARGEWVSFLFSDDVEGEGIFFRLALYERFLFVDRPLAVSRCHAWNMGKAVVRNREWLVRMHEKLRREPGLNPKYLQLVDTHEAHILRSCAWQGARLGIERGWVRNCLRRAVAKDPRSLWHPQAAAAVALALAPPRVAGLANRVGDHFAPDHHRVLVEDYGGITTAADARAS
ncbi:MAG: glycosyltransferase [Chloroflexi bacterium]|nr:glycosyltransferase [Chloroflexota bacterium]